MSDRHANNYQEIVQIESERQSEVVFEIKNVAGIEVGVGVGVETPKPLADLIV